MYGSIQQLMYDYRSHGFGFGLMMYSAACCWCKGASYIAHLIECIGKFLVQFVATLGVNYLVLLGVCGYLGC